MLCIILLASASASAQSVSGVITDTLNNRIVPNAVVMLITQKDSVLYKFARTDYTGKFLIQNVAANKYILRITHSQYGDYIDNIEVNGTNVDVGRILLTSKLNLLHEVVINGAGTIKIKGDTVVYTADSFKVRPNANVEDLLKKMPGIQVDKDGKITAMGETVKKVLVDGEEFFGDDPGIATKNIRADAVDKIEVFDKKSDEAAFTGIDDGKKDKTINIKLKASAKNGYFGKVDGGTNFDNYYNNDAMFNDFHGTQKIAAYGLMSNTGKTSLDWNENQNYGGSDGLTSTINDDGSMSMSYTTDNDDNYYNGQGGIPQNLDGGLHYSDKFADGKQSINAGYKISDVIAPYGQQTYTKTFVGDSSYNTNSSTTGSSTKIKQALNLTYEATIDTSNSLKLTAKGNTNDTKSNNNYTSESLNNEGGLINQSVRQTTGTTDNEALNASLLFRHKFKKKSRTFSLNSTLNITNSTGNNYLYAQDNYYTLNTSDTINQHTLSTNYSQAYSATATYTEPLTKVLFASVYYAYGYNNDLSNKTVYAKDYLTDNYTNEIDSLSNNFRYQQFSSKPGFNLRVNTKKLSYGIGAAMSFNNYIENNLTADTTRHYHFVDFFPSAYISLNMKNNCHFNINYNGSNTAPSLNQLQPIINNSDPLNKYVGNPDLKPSFNNSIFANYNSYNVLKERNLWAYMSGTYTQNAFVTESDINSAGQTISKTVNVNGVYNIYVYGEYGLKWKGPDIRFGAGPNFSASRNISVVNGQDAVNNNNDYGINFSLYKEKNNKYSISLRPSLDWVIADNSINTTASEHYWQIGGYADIDITLPKKFNLNTSFDAKARQKNPAFPVVNQYIWNASLTKYIYKESLQAGIKVNDILNQNQGYNRSFSDYRYTETYYTTLKRYWLLTLTWNFKKNGKPTSDF